ncbi:MAG: hypothetical protein HY023_05560 [Chloroflexi bacterium]|nr:hypothetical protein [Chloroflexota bacterium]
MNGETVVALVDSLIHSGLPEAAQLAKSLGTTFKVGPANPYWTTYDFPLANSPLARGGFRLSKDGQKALLYLETDNSSLVSGDLDLAAWGPVVGISPNPRIPPEGADAYIYLVDGVRVSVQYTHQSKKLLGVSLEWGTTA